jgi:hypothetical protein
LDETVTDLQKLLDHMREVAGKRAKEPWGRWLVTTDEQELPEGGRGRVIHGAAPPHPWTGERRDLDQPCADAEFIALADRYFDQMLAVCEAAKICIEELDIHFPPEKQLPNSQDSLGVQRCREALAKLAEVKIG